MSKQLGIRVDDDLYEALKADAEANGRTVTQSVRFLLQKATAKSSWVLMSPPAWSIGDGQSVEIREAL